MDGILIIDKPKDMTSHDVVNIARKSLSTKKIGHTGTLDPNATGVLVLVVGKATKLVKYFSNDSKKYLCKFRLGQAYDTDDITGKLTSESQVDHLTELEIMTALKSFLGKQEQIPPSYSAIKHEGRKLYELARKNIMPRQIDARQIEVFSIDDIQIEFHKNYIDVSALMHVSKGTYIRAIARDLGEKLNNYGTLVDLRRISSNGFEIENSFSIDQLRKGEIEIKDPFDYLPLPKIVVNENIKDYIEHGRFLDIDMFAEKTDTILMSKSNEVLAIYHYDEQKNQMRMSVKWI